jgi:uncharacterized protein (DUF4415 family)
MKTTTRGASSRRGEPSRTKDAASGKASKTSRGTDWERLRHPSDADIRKGIEADSEVHPTDEEFWKNAKVVLPRPKEVVTMRLDADLLEWFRQHEGYQTRINAILRAYMKANSGR